MSKNFGQVLLLGSKKAAKTVLPFLIKKTTEWSVAYADSTFLPLRRRRANTLRPFFVLILSRNPCTLLLFLLFG